MRDDDLVYLSFDRFPAPKGAAVHIAAFVQGLRAMFRRVDLLTPEAGEGPSPAGVAHHPLPLGRGNLIEQVLRFRAATDRWWRARGEVQVAHFRSIFEGYPLVRRRAGRARLLVYEVNALPSIELPYQWPAAAEDDELLAKLHAQERACLTGVDLVVTTNEVTAALLLARGARAERLRVIPNGVDEKIFTFAPPPERSGVLRMLYAGTLAPWQGLGVALQALERMRGRKAAHLTVVGPARKRQYAAFLAAVRDRGLGDAVTLLPPVSQQELVRLHHESDVALAPLLAGERNCVQGACPLKVIEAMAAGTPVVASDLPVVRALTGDDATLVPAGDAEALANALVGLDVSRAGKLARAARRRVEEGMTWTHRQVALRAAYREMLAGEHGEVSELRAGVMAGGR
jgi:glycosyltransferase involved in cell wall biosynthesis